MDLSYREYNTDSSFRFDLIEQTNQVTVGYKLYQKAKHLIQEGQNLIIGLDQIHECITNLRWKLYRDGDMAQAVHLLDNHVEVPMMARLYSMYKVGQKVPIDEDLMMAYRRQQFNQMMDLLTEFTAMCQKKVQTIDSHLRNKLDETIGKLKLIMKIPLSTLQDEPKTELLDAFECYTELMRMFGGPEVACLLWKSELICQNVEIADDIWVEKVAKLEDLEMILHGERELFYIHGQEIMAFTKTLLSHIHENYLEQIKPESNFPGRIANIDASWEERVILIQDMVVFIRMQEDRQS